MRACGTARATVAAISRAAVATASREPRPSRTAPTSLLWTMSREMSFSTTGNPMRAAASAAASAVGAAASRATFTP